MSRKDTLNALFRVAPSRPAAEPQAGSDGGVLGAPNRKAAGPDPAPPLGAPNGPRGALPSSGPSLKPSADQVDGEPAPRVRAGAVGALAGSLRDLTEEARAEAESLRQALSAAEQVVAIDPSLIDPAPVADRLRGADDPALDDLKRSMADVGQQVPVLVRPHPQDPRRFQAAYGHRRIRAARELGLKVRAVIRNLDDGSLAIAQGQENIARRDLSFIEKALFAQGMEQAGLPRATIIRALATDKGDLSRYLAVAAAVPVALAQAIGPAPKAGRARWMALVAALDAVCGAEDKALSRWPAAVAALMEKEAFRQADSDGRFALVLSALGAAAGALQSPADEARRIMADDGRELGRMRGTGARAELTIHVAADPAFARHLAAELPTLYRRWLDAGGSEGGET